MQNKFERAYRAQLGKHISMFHILHSHLVVLIVRILSNVDGIQRKRVGEQGVSLKTLSKSHEASPQADDPKSRDSGDEDDGTDTWHTLIYRSMYHYRHEKQIAARRTETQMKRSNINQNGVATKYKRDNIGLALNHFTPKNTST